MALEQYYNAIPQETAEWLRDQQPSPLMEAAGKVVEYQQNHKSKEMADTLEVTHLENRKEMKIAIKRIKAVNYSGSKITVMY